VPTVTEPPTPGKGTHLQFNSPLSTGRADRLAGDLAAALAGVAEPTVLDLGCGWGELLLRIVARAPGSRGLGVDTHGADLVRGRDNAAARGLAQRVTFVDGPAADHGGEADVVVNIGAYHAFGTISAALAALRRLVRPGGRLLFGAEFWEQPPPPQRLANMWPGMTADDCTDLVGLVDGAVAAGFRPLRIESATRGEWEEFESGLAANEEDWLLRNTGHPQATAVRERLDKQRSIWLRGHRGLMGFAYLTLGRPT